MPIANCSQPIIWISIKSLNQKQGWMDIGAVITMRQSVSGERVNQYLKQEEKQNHY